MLVLNQTLNRGPLLIANNQNFESLIFTNLSLSPLSFFCLAERKQFAFWHEGISLHEILKVSSSGPCQL